jgi:multiple sugar transport system substrate-binding protein
MKRRKFLKATGAGVAATGLAGILAAHRAPVFAQANTIHILRWNDFVPAADKVLREVYVPEVQKALGIKLNVETVNANDIPARATAAIQSGSGPDIIMLLNWTSSSGRAVNRLNVRSSMPPLRRAIMTSSGVVCARKGEDRRKDSRPQ